MVMKTKRNQFDASKKLYVLRPFVYDVKKYKSGQVFPVDADNKKSVTRARQLYQIRHLTHSRDEAMVFKAALGPAPDKQSKEKLNLETEVTDDMDL